MSKHVFGKNEKKNIAKFCLLNLVCVTFLDILIDFEIWEIVCGHGLK